MYMVVLLTYISDAIQKCHCSLCVCVYVCVCFISMYCILSGNIWPQFAEPPWTDPGIKSGISVHKLISASEKKRKSTKEAQAGNE